VDAKGSKSTIAMTTPVLMEKKSKQIAMTAPVLMDKNVNTGSLTMSFVLPSEYTIDTLPKPLNERIVIKEVAGHDMAVIKYSWYLSDARADVEEAKLRVMCERDGVKVF
jgi:hypothetical protein